MRASQKFNSSPATSLVVNSKSAAGFAFDGALTFPSAAKNVLSGAMTANALKTILSIGGRGKMPMFGVKSIDSTSRTVRIKITADGVVVFDYTSAALASGGEVAVIIGDVGITTGSTVAESLPITWNASLLIECASSLTETDKFGFYYKYQLEG